MPGVFARAQRSGCHCKFTTKLWKGWKVAQDTNPAVWVDVIYAFVVFASCELVRKSAGWLALETATGSP